MKKNYPLLTTGIIALSINSIHAQCPVPSSVMASPSSICAGKSTTLNATATGASISWFNVPSAGSSLGTSGSGANIAFTPTSTTTYYAESYAIGTVTLNYTGAMQTFTVPLGITSLTIITKGAQGQKASTTGSLAGNGGAASGILSVTPGQILNIFVGGQSGYNGGGAYWGNVGLTCNGGGASDVRFPGILLTDRLIVAGGGGGVSGESSWGNGGHGGGGSAVGSNFVGGQGGAGYSSAFAASGATNGGAGTTSVHGGPGGGGGLISGGGGAISSGYGGSVAGTGSLGIGGSGNSTLSGCCQLYGCAGGGGGYYGGGGVAGGCCGGGGAGGGSSWTGTLTSPTFSSGIQTGNGQVIIILPNCTSVSRTAVTVTVGAIPTVSVTSGLICSGQSFTMVASGASTYSYTGGSAVVTPTATMSYSVTGTSSVGCVSSNTAVSSVTVDPSPVPTISASTPNSIICIGETSVLTVSTSATSYTWNTGATTISISVTPTVTTLYTVNGANTVGCMSSANVNVTVNACTGINELTASLISVYPNPNNGIVNISLTAVLAQNSSLEIYDALGKLVVKHVLASELNSVNISHLNNGIYVFKVLNNNNTLKIGKLIKQ